MGILLRMLLLALAGLVHGLPSLSSVSEAARALQADADALEAAVGAADGASIGIGGALTVGDDDDGLYDLEKRTIDWAAERGKLDACAADAPAATAACAREKWDGAVNVAQKSIQDRPDEAAAIWKEAIEEFTEQLLLCHSTPVAKMQSHFLVTHELAGGEKGPAGANDDKMKKRPLVQWIQNGDANTLYIHQLQKPVPPEHRDARPVFDISPQDIDEAVHFDPVPPATQYYRDASNRYLAGGIKCDLNQLVEGGVEYKTTLRYAFQADGFLFDHGGSGWIAPGFTKPRLKLTFKPREAGDASPCQPLTDARIDGDHHIAQLHELDQETLDIIVKHEHDGGSTLRISCKQLVGDESGQECDEHGRAWVSELLHNQEALTPAARKAKVEQNAAQARTLATVLTATSTLVTESASYSAIFAQSAAMATTRATATGDAAVTSSMAAAIRSDKETSFAKWVMPVAVCVGSIAVGAATMGGGAPLAIAGCAPLVAKLAQKAAEAANKRLARKEKLESVVVLEAELGPEVEKLNGLLVKLNILAADGMRKCDEQGANYFECAAQAGTGFDGHQLRNLRHISCIMNLLKPLKRTVSMAPEERVEFDKYVAVAKASVQESRSQMASLVTLASALTLNKQGSMLDAMSDKLDLLLGHAGIQYPPP